MPATKKAKKAPKAAKKGVKVQEAPKRRGRPPKVATAQTNGKAPKATKKGGFNMKHLKSAAVGFKTLGDPTRLTIMVMLRDGEQRVSDLANILDQSQPAVSHHLALLRSAGFVFARREGKNNFYNLSAKGESIAPILDNAQEMGNQLGPVE